MDPLVTVAAAALVSAIVGDAWAASRDGVLDVWRRVHPRRVRVIDAALDEASGEGELVRVHPEAPFPAGQLEEDWQNHFHALLRDHPDARDDVEQLIREVLVPGVSEPGKRAELTTLLNNSTGVVNNVNNVTVTGKAQAAVAARDIHWNTRD
ncbi:hypothetical protein [Streptomyces asoensis]|uniref:hypothetical protein n=1 Tax=Streptomyces asoensis TaxID=249586 RepID=UPI001676CEE8|nr:hypothetical protein [Streptomyces asoensis]